MKASLLKNKKVVNKTKKGKHFMTKKSKSQLVLVINKVMTSVQSY